MKKYYAGIGSRETPAAIVPTIQYIARMLLMEGYTLRSGGAEGADTFFEQVVPKDKKDIYLPWYCFNSNTSPICRVSEEAIAFSLKYHPNPSALSVPAQKLMGRNACQVLGEDLKTPADFIVCWTRDGLASGGTGQAIRIAAAHEIPVYNINAEGCRLIADFQKWYSDNNFDIM
jgi:hypothetical protein